MDARVCAVEVWHLRLPLSRVYHLSFGDLYAFDTILVRVRTADGRQGWGETTPLPGYSHEDAGGVWRALLELSADVRGRGLSAALALLGGRAAQAPFACTGLATACEHALAGCAEHIAGDAVPDAPSSPRLTDPGGGRVALIGTIRSSSPNGIADDVPRLLREGYTTLKIKVGSDVPRDIANVRTAQSALHGAGRLRIDANQGYTLDEAQAFLCEVSPDGIELFEQPFPPERWDWMERLGAGCPVPLMLDESIETEEDIARAARTPGVRYVKFKLMKAGSGARLRALCDRAGRLGLRVVVGNGVAGELGCIHEARTVAGRLSLPGEMNGFLKLTDSLLTEPIRVLDGTMIVPPAERVGLRRDRLQRHAVEACTV
jgi:L-Ala-D/L-Glu epimerase